MLHNQKAWIGEIEPPIHAFLMLLNYNIIAYRVIYKSPKAMELIRLWTKKYGFKAPQQLTMIINCDIFKYYN